jgi:hypothetical protein
MAHFVQFLTSAGSSAYMNIENISYFEPSPGKPSETNLFFNDGRAFTVSLSAQQIMRLIGPK